MKRPAAAILEFGDLCLVIFDGATKHKVHTKGMKTSESQDSFICCLSILIQLLPAAFAQPRPNLLCRYSH